MTICSKNQYLISSGADDTIKMFNLKTLKQEHVIEIRPNCRIHELITPINVNRLREICSNYAE